MSFYSEKMKHFDKRYDGFVSRCTMKSDSQCINTTGTSTTTTLNPEPSTTNLVQQQDRHRIIQSMHKIQHIPKGSRLHRLQQHSHDRKIHCDIPLHHFIPSEDNSSIDSASLKDYTSCTSSSSLRRSNIGHHFHDDETNYQHSLEYNRLGHGSGPSQQVDATIPRMKSHLNDNQNLKNQPKKLYTQYPNCTDFAVKRSTYDEEIDIQNTNLSTSASLQEHLRIPISIRRPLSSISEHSAAEASTYSHHIRPVSTWKTHTSAAVATISSNTKPNSAIQGYYEDSDRFTNHGQLYQSQSNEDNSSHHIDSRLKGRSSTLSSSYFVPPKDRFQHGHSQRRANLTRPANRNKENNSSKEAISYAQYVSTSLDDIQENGFIGIRDDDDLVLFKSSSEAFPLDTIHRPPKHKGHPWDTEFNEKRICSSDDSFQFWQCHPKHTQQKSVAASSIDTGSIAPSLDEQLYHMEAFHDVLPKRSAGMGSKCLDHQQAIPTNEYVNDNDTSSGEYHLRKEITDTNGIDYDTVDDDHVHFVSQDRSIDSKSTYSRYEDGSTEAAGVDDEDHYNDDNINNDNQSVSSQRSILDILFNDYNDCLVDTEDSWKEIWNTFVLREQDIAAIVNRIDTAMYELDATTVEYNKKKQKKTTTTTTKSSRGRTSSRTRIEKTDRTTSYEV